MNQFNFLHQIIILPPHAWRVVEKPSAAERLTITLIKCLLFFLRLYARARLAIRNAARSQTDRYRLAGFVLAVSAAVILEDALIALITPLLPVAAA